MGIFSLLSEIKIKDWLRRKESPDYVAPAPVEKTEIGKPIEAYLLDDILSMIKYAGTQDGVTRKETLSKISKMEIQLLASLEQGGYPLMARQMEETILKAKAEHIWSGSKQT